MCDCYSYDETRAAQITEGSQPKPVPNNRPPTWHQVVADMLKRDNEGREKYNTPLQAFNGRDSLQDAYEEVLDLAVYLKNAIIERTNSR